MTSGGPWPCLSGFRANGPLSPGSGQFEATALCSPSRQGFVPQGFFFFFPQCQLNVATGMICTWPEGFLTELAGLETTAPWCLPPEGFHPLPHILVQAWASPLGCGAGDTPSVPLPV